MASHSQTENVLWTGTIISAIEHQSELVGHLDKLGIWGHDQTRDLVNNLVVQSELGIADILPEKPFRDLFGREV